MATLNEYAEAYCAKDLDRLMTIFVDGEDISLIGTGADELSSGRSAVAAVFERNFRDATATQFEWLWKDVVIHSDAATVAITLNIHLTISDAQSIIPIRWTVSLVKVGNDWKWIHRHASAASSAQNKGSAYPTDEG
ncbi:MAG: nuclear transport factor 2 family protein [Pseudomonadota bacterium]